MKFIEKTRAQISNITATARHRAQQVQLRKRHHNRLADLGGAYFRGRDSEEDTDAELDRLMDEVRELAGQLEAEPAHLDLTDQDEDTPDDDTANDVGLPAEARPVGSA